MAILSLLFTLSAFAAERPVAPGIAASPALVGGIAASFAFAEDFEKKNNRPLGGEFVGFDAVKGEETTVGVYAIPAAGQLTKEAYGCHFHENDKGLIDTAHCHGEDSRETFAFEPGARVLPLAKFEEAAVEAAELFTKKFGTVANISRAKLWQTGGNVELALTFTPAGQPMKTVFMMCHQHGASSFDCHTQSRPGRNEPSR